MKSSRNRNVVSFGIIATLLLSFGWYAFGANSVVPASVMRPLTTVQRAAIDDSSGNILLVDAVPGQKIQLRSATLAADGATTWQFKSNTTPLSGPMAILAVQWDGPTGNPTFDAAIPQYETAAGEGLYLVLGSPVHIGGSITYTTSQ